MFTKKSVAAKAPAMYPALLAISDTFLPVVNLKNSLAFFNDVNFLSLFIILKAAPPGMAYVPTSSVVLPKKVSGLSNLFSSKASSNFVLRSVPAAASIPVVARSPIEYAVLSEILYKPFSMSSKKSI